ncbi:cobalt-precorrin-4/precorrin-4 C(11)-methyltransferase [Micromonospora okii]|uniref:cobalt-precorrin-4/precorrin-4 C(11)-methyltransferase n=1 Tax=Micromonospora okii TaxID=1182970 RepID=UPI001E619A70|nr:SAM-dependent methyltransferase [Micromonospora okii]
MTVYFIGAGPGAADLITVRGQRILSRAQACLYAGSLVPAELLACCLDDARRVDTADLTLDEIVAARADGHDVARLCSGDPALFSAVAEQTRRLDMASVPYKIVPGVPAYAAAATLGRELIAPTIGQPVILTRAQARSTPMPPRRGSRGARTQPRRPGAAPGGGPNRQLAATLAEHYGADCSVAVAANASRADEVVLRGLADIADQVAAADVRRTAVIIVGAVLAADSFPDSYLYSPR